MHQTVSEWSMDVHRHAFRRSDDCNLLHPDTRWLYEVVWVQEVWYTVLLCEWERSELWARPRRSVNGVWMIHRHAFRCSDDCNLLHPDTRWLCMKWCEYRRCDMWFLVWVGTERAVSSSQTGWDAAETSWSQRLSMLIVLVYWDSPSVFLLCSTFSCSLHILLNIKYPFWKLEIIQVFFVILVQVKTWQFSKKY